MSTARAIHLEVQMNEISGQDWDEALNLCADLMDDTKKHVHDIQTRPGENKEGMLDLYYIRIKYIIRCIRKASKMMKAAYPMHLNIVNPKYD